MGHFEFSKLKTRDKWSAEQEIDQGYRNFREPVGRATTHLFQYQKWVTKNLSIVDALLPSHLFILNIFL